MTKTRWNYIIPLIVIIALNLCGSKIYGFEVSTTNKGKEIKWKKDTITYLINTTDGPSGSLDAILAAMQTWTDVDTSTFTFIDDGATSKNNHGKADGINIIDFGTIKDEGVLGQNSFWFYTTGEMFDSDIRFNTKNTWSTDTSSDKFDVQNVGTHELGHSLSLADLYSNSDSEKTMYGYGFAGDISQRTLHQDDMDGITYLYPSTKNSSISGTIIDTEGTLLEDVKLRLKKGRKTKKKTKSDENGYFEFTNLKGGYYKIIARKSGYKKSKTKVELDETEDKEIEIIMEEK
ncbi:MAG: carboxypeptidase regulatory-like domain-containing protein [Candidatus Kuenenia sp.]|nr:carboxypeptidase regulatory-like domain-containing protein [Candidatus Kuenenia sp.]